jgi:predicted SAM-dependent methyltransferase
MKPEKSKIRKWRELFRLSKTPRKDFVALQPTEGVVQYITPGSRMLNIGCGSTFHFDWENIDISPYNEHVREVDAINGLPYSDSSFDVVYSSHVLEHLAPHAVPSFLAEIRRVLSPGGLLRVVVPDLELMARCYLKALEGARSGKVRDRLRHRWMIIELCDQMVREHPDGGEMMRFLLRNGEEGFSIAEERAGYEISGAPMADGSTTKKQWMLEAAKNPWFSDEQIFKRRAAAQRHEIEDFRRKGEIHLWMYDALSLGDLLLENHFSDVTACRASQSAIPEFMTYNLDTLPDGLPRKPDSLYMEARKGSASPQ